MRKKLGEKKLLNVIKRIGNKEQRIVDDKLHKISRQLVNLAKENNSCILLGDLSGIRNKKKGKRLNRIISNMPFYKLKQFITYKANWEGIPVLETKEWYSSSTCNKCGSDNTKRPYQGLFVCNSCGYQVNADYNGSLNLGKRLLKHVFDDGVVGFQPENETNFLKIS